MHIKLDKEIDVEKVTTLFVKKLRALGFTNMCSDSNKGDTAWQ